MICLYQLMNFLSHYHFYKNENIYYNMGLLLPDFVKAFCKTHLRLESAYVSPFFKQLQAGAQMHLDSDRVFHNSVFFKQACAEIAYQLDEKGPWPRKWFFNHLLCEILIDRVLMDKYPRLCGDFYSDLKQVNTTHVTAFLKMSGLLNYQNFEPGFEKFIQIQFLFDYQHNEKIIFALNRLYGRVGIDYLFSEDDKRVITKQIPFILTYLSENLTQLEEELK